MSDIVERLRTRGAYDGPSVTDEAAAEIDRLRAEVARLRAMVDEVDVFLADTPRIADSIYPKNGRDSWRDLTRALRKRIATTRAEALK